MKIGNILRSARDHKDPRSIAFKQRAKRIRPLLAMIEAVHRERGEVRLADIGGTEAYWRIVPAEYLEKFNLHITIFNLSADSEPEDPKRFKFVRADGCCLSMVEDKSFDIAHSNSVIEHVGGWGRQVLFAREVVRIAPRIFIQTPNFWFPVEQHSLAPFWHWLPRSLQIGLLSHIGLGLWEKTRSDEAAILLLERYHLLDKKKLKSLFKNARIETERFFGLAKSFVVIFE